MAAEWERSLVSENEMRLKNKCINYISKKSNRIFIIIIINIFFLKTFQIFSLVFGFKSETF